MRVKKFDPNKKRGHTNGGTTTYVNPTPLLLLVNLVSSSDGNDIGVGLTYSSGQNKVPTAELKSRFIVVQKSFDSRLIVVL